MTSGKWFWEGTKCGGSGAIGQFGFANSSASLTESYSSGSGLIVGRSILEMEQRLLFQQQTLVVISQEVR